MNAVSTEAPRLAGSDVKAKATLIAEFALRGYSLAELSDGTFLVHRWNLSRPLVDLRAASEFLRQLGGRAA